MKTTTQTDTSGETTMADVIRANAAADHADGVIALGNYDAADLATMREAHAVAIATGAAYERTETAAIAALTYRNEEGKTMARILVRAGYSAHDTEKLQAEGMGPEELRERVKVTAGTVGSLGYTHGLHRV